MRKLLLMHNSCDDTLSQCNALGESWAKFPVADIESARVLAKKHDFRVGIVRIHNQSGEGWRHPMEDFLTAIPGIQWLAIVDRHALAGPMMRDLIAEYCFDYHTLPIHCERLHVTLGHAFGMSVLANSMSQGDNRAAEASSLLVGNSAPIQRLKRVLHKVAEADAPVLVTGESGTGKELAARTIHQLSDRAGGPFVALNCAALPESLIQTELFGYEKGAFTGADKMKIGHIESADGGTIFLDEIGDLSVDTQSTLLRFLQEKTIEHIGNTKTLHVDARVIAATHVELKHAVANGTFREDLYHRLNVLPVETPPLRACRADIELFAIHFFKRFENEKQGRLRGFSREALNLMHSYDWPGNIRELMNCIRRAMIMSDSRLIKVGDLGLERRAKDRRLATLEEVRSEADKYAIQCALENAHNHISRAAEILGVSRITLYRLLEKYGIQRRPGERASSPGDAPGTEKKTLLGDLGAPVHGKG